jgi:hypothetical protein
MCARTNILRKRLIYGVIVLVVKVAVQLAYPSTYGKKGSATGQVA